VTANTAPPDWRIRQSALAVAFAAAVSRWRPCELAQALGVAWQSTLSRWGDELDRWPVPVVLHFATIDAPLAAALAEFALARAPAQGDAVTAWRSCADLVSSSCRLVATVGDAMADGQISPQEADDIADLLEVELVNLRQRVAHLRARAGRK